MSVSGGTSAAWPEPEPFDADLKEAEQGFWAKRSKAMLGWWASDTEGLQRDRDKGREGVVAVKNNSSTDVLVVVCTGRESLFPVSLSLVDLRSTGAHIDLRGCAGGSTGGVTLGGSAKRERTYGKEEQWAHRPEDQPRIITATRVPRGRGKQLIAVGPIRQVYLHMFFGYNPATMFWEKKVLLTPILPVKFYYVITDNLLESCTPAALDYQLVMQDLSAMEDPSMLL